MTWSKCKMKVKKNKKWIYDDCAKVDPKKVFLFEKVWEDYGERFCYK